MYLQISPVSGRWCVRLGLACAIVGSTIAFGSPALAQVPPPDSQIVPDSTLGGENSLLNSNPNGLDTISGGARRGSNLFHSFDRFSIPNGRAALFDNGANIQNILTRVTGSSVSDIDGLIQANGANLFLLNPNGIVFGQNARLNIGGSFIATTASSINFADGTQLSATPGTGAPLLTVSVPLGLQFGTNQGNIVNRASDEGLQVDPGKTLGLIGGNINLEGGRLTARGGRIELGAVAAPGVVGINTDTSGFRFSFPTDLVLGDISLRADASVSPPRPAVVDTRAGGGGSIAINARNLSLTEGSQIVTGIYREQGSLGAVAGDIDINNAQGTITIDGRGQFPEGVLSSGIFNNVETNSVGKGGNINLKANSLSLTNGGVISASVFGTGDTGNIDITAREGVSLSNGSTIFGRAEETGRGNGGDITIKAGSLSLTNNARINAGTLGKGNSGNILLRIDDAIALSSSYILSSVGIGAEGNGGTIDITARTLSLTNGGQIVAQVEPSEDGVPGGRGNGGKVMIDLRDAFSASGSGNGLFSGVFTAVGSGAEGKGGDIEIKARALSLSDGARINASTLGKGNAGNIFLRIDDAIALSSSYILSSVGIGAGGNGGTIDITARTLSLTNGGQIVAQVEPSEDGVPGGRGNGGKVMIDLRDAFSASGSGNGLFSGVFTAVGSGAEGKGGDIEIKARALSLSDGARINASTLGKGNAGNIFLRIDDSASFSNSYIFSSVTAGAVGDGGTIDIKAGTLSLTNGAQIVAQVEPSEDGVPGGRGNGGKVMIDLRDAFSASGSGNGLFSGVFTIVNTGAEGKGGDINIKARSMSLTNNGQLNTSSNGQGNAGNIDVKVRTLNLDKGGIFAESTSGNGGDIRLRASKSVRLRNGSLISTSAGGTEQGGNGGNITINSPLVIANFNGNNDITANAFRGSGGRIEINAQSIIGLIQRSRQDLISLIGTDTPTELNFLAGSDTNDVAAISLSDPSLSGTVSFNAADIDPSRDIVELPTGLVDASSLVAAGCPSGAENRFTVAGRGGLPPAPGDKLSPDALLTDWATLQTPETENRAAVETTTPVVTNTTHTPPVETITEATSWQYDRNGAIILTSGNTTSPDHLKATPTSCPSS